MPFTITRAAVVSTLALSLVAGGVAAGRLTPTDPAFGQAAPIAVAASEPQPAPLASGRRSFAPLVARAAPAVVHIKVTSVANAMVPDSHDRLPPGFPVPPRQGGMMQRGSGSGFILRPDGIILTNHHVVDHAKEITVVLSDGRELSGTVLGRDPKTDLAVVKVDSAVPLPVAPLGDSDALHVGDWVVAIGNPFGLSNTVTAGIVSAKARAIGAGPYDQFIQTDAPINPGNSGGPLFDEHGHVVGINTAIFSRGGGSIGIGFAIPVNLAKQLVPQLEENGHVTRGWLGVAIQKLTPELAESLGVEPPHGALVSSVLAQSPAAAAGIEAGDVIVAYDGQAVADAAALPMLVAQTGVGKTVSLDVVRHGRTASFEVRVAKLADDEAVARRGEKAPASNWGLRLRDLKPHERAQRDLDADRGVLVVGITPNGPADQAGIEAGDVILEVNRTPVASAGAVRTAVARHGEGKPLLLLVRAAAGNDRFAALAAR